jgi:hypothetical protein
VKLTFGIRKGSEVRRVKSDYLQWLLHYNRDLDPALVREMLAELHRRHAELLAKYGLGGCVLPLPAAHQWGRNGGSGPSAPGAGGSAADGTSPRAASGVGTGTETA